MTHEHPVLAKHKSKLIQIFEKHPIQLAYLFGSAAKESTTPLSDVDIAILMDKDAFDPKRRLRFELSLEDEIDQVCKLSTADVRVINEAPILIRGEVVSNGLLLYSKDDRAKVDFETQTRSRYFDFLPFANAINNAYLSNIAKYGIIRG